MKFLLSILSLLAMSNFAQAQSPIDDMVKDWERAKAYTYGSGEKTSGSYDTAEPHWLMGR